MRDRIEAAWGNGFTASDIYGLSEVIGPGVAMESPAAKGAMYVFADASFDSLEASGTKQGRSMSLSTATPQRSATSSASCASAA